MQLRLRSFKRELLERFFRIHLNNQRSEPKPLLRLPHPDWEERTGFHANVHALKYAD